MNEKIKNFFAGIGAFFSAAAAIVVGIAIGRRAGNKADNGRVSDLEERRADVERGKRSEDKVYREFRDIFERIEARYEKDLSEGRAD